MLYRVFLKSITKLKWGILHGKIMVVSHIIFFQNVGGFQIELVKMNFFIFGFCHYLFTLSPSRLIFGTGHKLIKVYYTNTTKV